MFDKIIHIFLFVDFKIWSCFIEIGAAFYVQINGGFLFLVVPPTVQKRHFHGQNCSDSKTIKKESVFADASWWAKIPGFRRFEPMPSDLSYAIESRRFDVGRSLVSSAGTHHQVDSRL